MCFVSQSWNQKKSAIKWKFGKMNNTFERKKNWFNKTELETSIGIALPFDAGCLVNEKKTKEMLRNRFSLMLPVSRLGRMRPQRYHDFVHRLLRLQKTKIDIEFLHIKKAVEPTST